jgi:hypothetical protein
VIGNGRKLYFDTKWKEFIEYSIRNNSCFNCNGLTENPKDWVQRLTTEDARKITKITDMFV